ncbi:uncharacterized protein LOC136078302 [Hydra vulgaris]|uniref:Uncharacterized protein LOC136078302 n=1 Tax=Hydra vulgaris TaxID=6087 RepID=A0ABM4BLC4_HYDVU
MLEIKENKFFLHVNPGDIQYVKLVIKSLYNPEIIDNIKTIKLLKVLEYADRYMCDSLLKRGLSIVKNIVVTSVDECSFLLHKIAYFENYLEHLLTKDFFLDVKSYCSQFLAKTFTPLEGCAYNKSLIELDFLSFLTLLKSDDEFLFSENSAFACVLNWLEANEIQQTEENIKSLLSECRYEYMNVLFLRNGLCYTNPIFSNWSGYLNWYINAVSYPSIQKNAAVTSKRTNREKKRKINEKLCYKYELQMKYNANTKSWTSDKSMLYHGCVLQFFIYATNKVMLEMILGKDNQKKEISNFNFEIPVKIEIPEFIFTLERDEAYQTSDNEFCDFFSLQNVNKSSTPYTKKVIFQFSKVNIANISLGYILEYEPDSVQNKNDMIVVITFTL